MSENAETVVQENVAAPIDPEASIAATEVKIRKAQTRRIRGAHLVDTFIAKALAAGLVQTENANYHKFTGPGKKHLLVLKKGGRVDVSGFNVDAPGLRQFSPEEAKAKHIGKVTASFDMDASDEDILATFDAAVAGCAAPVAAPAPVVAPPAAE